MGARQRPSAFSIEVSSGRDHVMVAPHGELDLATSEQLAGQIEPLLEPGAVHVLVDLAGLSFIDVAGLRALSGCARVARANGVRFTVVIANPRFRRLLALCQLLEEFELVYVPSASGSR